MMTRSILTLAVSSLLLTTRVAADCPGDVDSSGATDIQDLLSVLAAWGPCADCPEDIDGDDMVSIADLLLTLQNWGCTMATSTSDFVTVINSDVGGSADWLSPTNALASDDSRSTNTISGGATGDFLRFTDASSINVPLGSAIDGIEVDIEGHKDAGDDVVLSAQLYYNGNTIGNAKTSIALNEDTDTTQTQGGSSDDWGAALTADIVNDPTFGVQIQASSASTGGTGALDYVGNVVVHYTPPQSTGRNFPLGVW